MSPLKRLFGAFRKKVERSESEVPLSTYEWAVAGLGNPGREFEGSRHNAGYAVVDRIADANGARFAKRRFAGVTTEVTLGGHRVILVKPQTYYNLSGDCVSALLAYFKISVSKLIVVHDEIDLPVGVVRVKSGGGDAGNRGIKSLIASLGTANFVRIRIGTGKPDDKTQGRDYVIEPMTERQRVEFDREIEAATEALAAVICEGVAPAMNRFNQRPQSDEQPRD
jgi:PTH1 family peptidyl-tRNA hydrolase